MSMSIVWSPPTARWVVDGSPDPPYCSECMTFALEDTAGDYAMTKYCPECGALMLEIDREGVREWNRLLKYVPQQTSSATDRM